MQIVQSPNPNLWVAAYKIFEELDDGSVRTLFHKTSTDFIPGMEYWARNRWVRDGSGDGWYWSGWHCFVDNYTAERYLQKLDRANQRNLVIRKVKVRGLSVKPSNRDVLLAQTMVL